MPGCWMPSQPHDTHEHARRHTHTRNTVEGDLAGMLSTNEGYTFTILSPYYYYLLLLLLYYYYLFCFPLYSPPLFFLCTPSSFIISVCFVLVFTNSLFLPLSHRPHLLTPSAQGEKKNELINKQRIQSYSDQLRNNSAWTVF